MRLWAKITCAVVGAVAMTVPAAGQPALEDWLVERQESSWEVSETAEIELSNPWGDIAVRAHEHPEIYLLANWQHHRDDPRALEVSADLLREKITLAIGFADLELDIVPADWSSRRADITLFVPQHAVTHFSTAKGNLEVRGTRGPTTVETGGGDIKLRLYGGATVRTDHGSVLAQFTRTDWVLPVEITTTTGPIRVELPQDGRARTTLETRGEITSDYSMDVERVEGSQLKRARLKAGEAGSSGGTLQLMSFSGPIAVVETLVSAEKGDNTQ